MDVNDLTQPSRKTQKTLSKTNTQNKMPSGDFPINTPTKVRRHILLRPFSLAFISSYFSNYNSNYVLTWRLECMIELLALLWPWLCYILQELKATSFSKAYQDPTKPLKDNIFWHWGCLWGTSLVSVLLKLSPSSRLELLSLGWGCGLCRCWDDNKVPVHTFWKLVSYDDLSWFSYGDLS